MRSANFALGVINLQHVYNILHLNSDALVSMEKAMKRDQIDVNDRQVKDEVMLGDYS